MFPPLRGKRFRRGRTDAFSYDLSKITLDCPKYTKWPGTIDIHF